MIILFQIQEVYARGGRKYDPESGTYYAAERKRQNRWKIQCPALALSKEFDKLIRS